jgi:APA family basic amino acid/polyamine antiporter
MAERIPREQSLKRVHGPSALFAAAYGNVGSSIYYALGLVAAFALGLTPLTFLIAGVIFLFTAATYAEATVMYPEAGGSSSFARHAFNELVSFFAAWAQLLNYIITVAISAYFVPHYLAVFWPELSHAPADVIAGIVVVAGLALLNVRGTKESTKLNVALVTVDIMTAILMMGLGLVLVFDPALLVAQIEWGTAPTWSDFALSIAIGMIAYTGIETISNMAEEARKPIDQTVTRAVIGVVLAVIGLYAILPSIALSAMPVVERGGEFTTELATTYRDNPVLGVAENLGLPDGLTEVLRRYVGLLAGIILLIATNAGLIGVSRLTFSMGHHRQVPERLRQIHPRYRTPYVAICAFALLAAITILPGEAAFLATMYSFGAMLSFTIAHAAVLRLRVTQPDKERAWRAPWNIRWRGHALSLTAILGGAGTFLAWIVVIAMDPVTLFVGSGWMIFGLVLYLLYRRSQKLPIRRTVQVVTPTPLGVEEVEYESVLIAFDERRPFSEEVVATAARLAGPKMRAIHVISLITVPNSLPLNARLRRAEGEAANKIERAKLIAGMRVTGSVLRVRPGQAGYTIADKAREIRARAIVIGLRVRDGQPQYGETIRTVLAERPCRVIVVSPGETQELVGSTPIGAIG